MGVYVPLLMCWSGHEGGIEKVEVRMKRKRERKDKGKGKGKCTNDPS
jgi:hypothetical protein